LLRQELRQRGAPAAGRDGRGRGERPHEDEEGERGRSSEGGEASHGVLPSRRGREPEAACDPTRRAVPPGEVGNDDALSPVPGEDESSAVPSRRSWRGGEAHMEQRRDGPRGRAEPVRARVNGVDHEVHVREGESLLEMLRERLGVTSPKDGCAPQAQCGCCLALVGGKPMTACAVPATRVDGKEVTTLEG